MLGSLSEKDLAFIENPTLKEYAMDLGSKKKKVDWHKKFPNSSKELIYLLGSLLQFNPHLRPTASECLQFSVFDGIRKDGTVNYCNQNIIVDID